MTLLSLAGDLGDRAGLPGGNREPKPLSPFAKMQGEIKETRSYSDRSTRSSDEQLEALINSLPGMAFRCMVDSDWTMVFVSEGCFELTGYNSKDLIQNTPISYRRIVHPDDQLVARERINAALTEKKSYDISYRITTKNGEEKWVRELGRGNFSPQGFLLTLEGFITDITERKQAEKRSQRQMQRFMALRKIDMAISASLDLRVTFEVFLDQVITQLSVDATDVLLFNNMTQMLEYASGRGFHTSALQHTRLRIGEGFAGKAVLERRIVHIPNLNKEPGYFLRAPEIDEENFFCYFGVPLIAKGQVKGVLEVFHRTPFEPDAEWLEFLEALAGQAAIAIDNFSLFNELQRSNTELSRAYDETLEGWSKALELRDQETEGHTQRVTDMTLRLAQAMGVNHKELHHMRRGALLHDIGKVGIPDSILLKPGPLTLQEWEIMRQHPVYAYRLLSPIINLQPALDIPYCHHEKWNGTGYPRGLQKEQIPLAARIFAVVDVWDALRSDRPYRPAWSEERVFEYIRTESGKHFEPKVVEVFLTLI